jgi:acyl-coenzyme A synthetase/AMP-(fatty) acid ligase
LSIDFLIDRLAEYRDHDAIVWQDKPFSFQWLLEATRNWQEKLPAYGIRPGNVVALKADFSPNAVALFLSLAKQSCIIVPLTHAQTQNETQLLETAQCEFSIQIDDLDRIEFQPLPHRADHAHYQHLAEKGHPGLVLFSSGSTGPSKAALHDLLLILEKFRNTRKAFRSISFLLYDHIGGINTMLYLLSNGGCMVTVSDRSPDTVLGHIERYCVELLPTSPTFINLILLSEAHERYDLSSLKIVTYGTEPMPESTLKRIHQILPHVELRQTYGLSEIGIMQTQSKRSDSLWFRIGGEGFQTRIVDGILHIKARSAMIGYLNHPDPFTEDGWLVTGDRVEQDGDYIRIFGRMSEIINVGGEKVYPVTIESELQLMANVAEVSVFGKKNPITGQMVCANIRLKEPEEKKIFVRRLKKHCRDRLMPYMIPVKVNLVSVPIHSARYKKIRERHV